MLTGIIAIASVAMAPMLSQSADAMCTPEWTQSFSFTMSGYDGSATGSKTHEQVVCGETFTVTTVATQSTGKIVTTWDGPATSDGDSFVRILTEIDGGYTNRINESDTDTD